MASSSCTAALSANTCRVLFFNNCYNKKKLPQNLNLLKVQASSDQQEDCNVEECAPDKEVGKVSMEWLAGEKTKVAGTFPPRRRDWSGYVEKDTAGQTNIYSVEPAIYVAESAISSGTKGTSADGAENTAAITAGLGLIALAAASSILLQVGKNPPQVQTLDYSGPSLSYYITKFKPSEVVQTSAPVETDTSAQTQESSVETSETQMQTEPSSSSTVQESQIEVASESG